MGFKNVLDKAFPYISAAAQIGGLPAVLVTNMVGKALGIDKIDPTTDGINNAIAAAQAANPNDDIIVKLKQVEDDFQVKMKQMNIDSVEALLGSDNADRASARSREVAVKDRTPMILSYIVILVTLTVEGLVIFHGTPPGIDGVVLGRVLGTLDSAMIMVLAYYFGSSSGSDAKNKIFADHMAAADDKAK